MIRSSRAWHARIWPLLTLGVLSGIVYSVRTRTAEGERPRGAEGLPAAAAWAPPGAVPGPGMTTLPGEEPVQTEDHVFGDPGGKLAIYRRGDELVAVIVCDRCAVDHPDPLAYWAPGAAGEGLPAGAKLLGGVPRGEVALDLPVEAEPLHGQLILYSLGHAVVIGQIALGGGA